MIPKVIHYCWYGGKELPDLAVKCIESWKKYCPDYKIIRWDETNTNLDENDYIREAYEAKKWAFVTDYIRLKALYEYGGIYMDTDVEVCGSLDVFLNEQAFSGFENATLIPTGIMACEKDHYFFKRLLNYYDGKHFRMSDGTYDQTTNVKTITKIALEYGFIPNDTKQTICDMTFYPHDYFCPKDSASGIINRTNNTVCIHHFDGSWVEEKQIALIEWKKWKKLNSKYGKLGDYIYAINKYILHPRKLMSRLKEKIRKKKK